MSLPHHIHISKKAAVTVCISLILGLGYLVFSYAEKGDFYAGANLASNKKNAPYIRQIDYPSNIQCGRLIVFQPIFKSNDLVDTKYKWTIDGEEVSKARNLTFVFDDQRSYEIHFYAENEIGETSEELTIKAH